MTLTDSDKDLLLKAMCCVVAADGRVSGREITVIAEALTKAGFPTSPEQIRPAVIELSKTIHEKGTSLYARDLAARLFVSCDRDVATALLESLDALVNADGRATKRESEIERTFRAATHGVLATLSSPKYCRATYRPAGQPNGQWLGQALGACIGGCVAFLIVYAFSSHGASQQEAGLKALHSRSNAAQAAADHAMAAYTTQPNDRTLNELNNATTEAARSAIRFVDAAKAPSDSSNIASEFLSMLLQQLDVAIAVPIVMCAAFVTWAAVMVTSRKRM